MAEKEKKGKLLELLEALLYNQVIIFVKSVQRAEDINSLLERKKFMSLCMHSQLTQRERILRYRQFKEFNKRIMVSTDLLGRGIDIEKVNIVIN